MFITVAGTLDYSIIKIPVVCRGQITKMHAAKSMIGINMNLHSIFYKFQTRP